MFKTTSATYKMSIISIVLFLITAGTVGLIVFKAHNVALVNQEVKNLGDEANLIGIRLVSGIQTLRQDVLFLSKTPPIQGIIRARMARRDRPLRRRWLHGKIVAPALNDHLHRVSSS